MIDALIITFNESLNLPHCLTALSGWTRRVFVVDSGSTDGTPELAQRLGAQVVHHDWEGYAAQKNWALDHLPLEAPWTLIVDADEVITDDLRARLLALAQRPPEQVPENGFFVNRLSFFMGKPIKHCGYFPSWNLRFFKRGKGRYEVREVHEHIIIDNPVGYLREPMLHDDRRGLEHFVAKHNRYSTLEARAVFREMTDPAAQASLPNLTRATRGRRWLKRHVVHQMPFPGLWRFLYMYVGRLGFLDGRAGLELCKFISVYDYLFALKLRELYRQARTPAEQRRDVEPQRALARPEGAEALTVAAHAPATPPSDDQPPPQMRPESSPWTFREKLGRAVWMLVGRPAFRVTFHNWYGVRATILRLFGARIGKRVAIRPTVNVEVPWMLDIDDDATVGDHAILYSLGRITIGKRSIVSQYAHLCAGTHDYSDHTFRLIRAPVTVGEDAWIGADSFVGPGVTVGRLSVLGARSSAYKDLKPATVFVGNPARAVKERVLR